ncbi:MAG TPA: oligosaccharide flippase family protein [Terriglobales bacterium]|nr:oligosaccharide flippase family protein [Terriglobales bacterium]
MRKWEKRQIIKNVGSSWFALGINVVVGILLSPFILHRLGDAAFGVWVLIFSVTGYYGLFDLGIRSSIVRYVSKYTATNSTEEINKLINTSLFSYSCIGIVSLLLTFVGCLYVDNWFRIPAEFHSAAQWLLLMVGASVALGFPLGVAGGVLEGLQRFDVVNWTSIVSTLLRAALIVVALEHGYGLLMVAFITVMLPLAISVVRTVIAFRILPVQFGRRYIDRETFRQVAVYSGTTFMIMVAGRLKFKTDEIVIGAFLSAVAITYFNIGARIVDYAAEVVVSLAQIFVPMSSQSEATGETDRLRKIFVLGNRSCAFVIFPISATLVILGKSVIEVWVGHKYIATSYPVLLIMVIPSTIWLAQGASGRVLFGMAKHGTWAIVTLTEGVCNLLLSIALVRPYGIIGDALGTAIPLTCSMVFFMPGHLCGLLGIRLRTFLREAYALPLLLTAPLVVVLLAMRRWSVAHHYWELGAQLLIAGAVYGAGLWWAWSTQRAFRVGELISKGKSGQIELAAAGFETFQQDA